MNGFWRTAVEELMHMAKVILGCLCPGLLLMNILKRVSTLIRIGEAVL